MLNIMNLSFANKWFLLSYTNIVSDKKYTSNIESIGMNDVYIFENEEQYKNYFRENGIDEETINTIPCEGIIDPSGVIIAYKVLCDMAIKKYECEKKFQEINTPEKALKYAFNKKLKTIYK